MKDFLKIDLYKDLELYKYLSQFNPGIEEVSDNAIRDLQVHGWFDLRVPKDAEFFPIKLPGDMVKLHVYPPNYLTLSLINLLYSDKKDTLIEDVCCGPG